MFVEFIHHRRLIHIIKMEISDINIYAKSDRYYTELIGEFVRSTRLSQNKTQQQLADEAGINRTTLVQMEKGKPVNLMSLIQVLRVLKQLHIFSQLEIKPQLSPLMLAEMEHKYKQRASPDRDKKEKPKSDW